MLPNQMLWWQQGVIHQVYPCSFKDNNGEGIGDGRGIITQLEYLTRLAINAIWITPIYPSPMADFGYDIANFIDVDPIFGDHTMFDELVKERHKHDIKVIIDFVLNHTFDEHPGFSIQIPLAMTPNVIGTFGPTPNPMAHPQKLA